jgi:hypothetical protein
VRDRDDQSVELGERPRIAVRVPDRRVQEKRSKAQLNVFIRRRRERTEYGSLQGQARADAANAAEIGDNIQLIPRVLKLGQVLERGIFHWASTCHNRTILRIRHGARKAARGCSDSACESGVKVSSLSSRECADANRLCLESRGQWAVQNSSRP